jgi:hypothetical protein
VRHQALARFREGSVLLERFTQLATGLAQHVSQRNMPSLQSDRQNLGVHPIVLSPVRANTDGSNSGRVEHHWLVPPFAQLVVDRPSLSASLEPHPRRRLVWPQHPDEFLGPSDASSRDDHTVFHLTPIRCP